jgi:L-lactate dehydrogenase
MNQHSRYRLRKVVVVGAGAVGSSYAYALAQNGTAEQIIIIDKNEGLAKGQVLDLAHGLPYYPTIHIRLGTSSDYKDARVIVLTAGAKQQPGQNRLELLKINIRIIEDIVADIIAQKSEAIIIVVSNPVDILTYFAWKRSGWPREQVIGSGTVLDSARLRYLLSQHCNVDVKNVHAYVMGEHGDSEFAAWSMSHIGGISVKEFWQHKLNTGNGEMIRKEIEQQVRDSAYHIIDYKGATNYAVGLSLVRITEAILKNQRSVLTVSVGLKGEYGLTDVCIGVPCLVSDAGAAEIIVKQLPEQEQAALERSAGILRKAINEVNKEKTS